MSNAEVTAGLREAAALIRRGWTTGHQAIDAGGGRCHPCSDDAVAWCAYGALVRVSEARGSGRILACEMLDELHRYLLRDLIEWNDHLARDVGEVIALFERAMTGGEQ